MKFSGRFIPAAFVAAAVALGGSPIATAAPSDDTWDIEAYDNCMNKTVRDADLCCVDSGGVPGATKGSCHAPPAQAVESPSPGGRRTPIRPLPQVPVGDLPTFTDAG